MIEVFASSGSLLAQAGAAVHDTIFLMPTAASRGVLDQITAWASAVITLTLLVLSVVAIPALWRFRKMYRKVDHLIERIYGDVTPITHHARDITENVNYITSAIRRDVETVNATIDAANRRVQDAMAETDQRVKEFNALLAVVQEEAEHLFLSTASAVRGVQRGAEAFTDRGGMDFASDELDAADRAEDLAIQEEGDVNDRNTEPAAEAFPAAPRVRPRPGSRRRA